MERIQLKVEVPNLTVVAVVGLGVVVAGLGVC
jgi:hypothetical protein